MSGLLYFSEQDDIDVDSFDGSESSALRDVLTWPPNLSPTDSTSTINSKADSMLINMFKIQIIYWKQLKRIFIQYCFKIYVSSLKEIIYII